MTDVLTALDATFLELEQLDDGALMSIGGTMVFDPLPGGGAPSLADVHAELAARLDALPRYRQRLSSPRTGGLSWPRWQPDERFDISDHVRHAALPAPGSDAQLCDLTAELFSHPLDRRRPLWELVLVDGLERGRWALAHKTHHCLIDGVGSVHVVELLLDGWGGANDSPPSIVAGAKLRSPRQPRPPHPPDPVAQAAHAGMHAVDAGLHAVMHPRATLERSRALAETIVRDELVGAPRTSLNVAIGQRRRFAVVRVPLAELKAIGHEFGGTVNDAVLAASASGLRRLLVHRGDRLPAEGLRAMVPMSLRDPSLTDALGNRVTSLFVDLPVATPDPLPRMHAIASSTRLLKQGVAGSSAAILLDLAELVPPVVVHAALAQSELARRLFNVTITNVPGPQQPLHAFGARLREIHPVVPLAADHAVGIAVCSYDGLVTFGINADAASTPDLDVLAYGIEEGIEELLALVPGARHVDTIEPDPRGD
jgi:WS/DGAT/MGAT family acyltransferase